MLNAQAHAAVWLKERLGPYWLCQISGWLAFTVLSYLSLTIWYNPGQWAYVGHTILQSVLGLALSHPLRSAASFVWHKPFWPRAITISLAIVVTGTVWTGLRLVTLTMLTGEVVKPGDWGGWLNASIMVYGAWTFCYHALRYYRQSLDQQKRAALAQQSALEAEARATQESFRRSQLESQFKETQLRMLRYQLSPHFLFNALNSVAALVERGDKESASEMLTRISDFLRMSLHQTSALSHSLAEELDAIEIYLGIEKSRFGDRLVVEFDVAEKAKNALLPAFLLQPIFENAVKYAVGQQLNPTTIQCTASLVNEQLSVLISDTGPGFKAIPKRGTPQSLGIGMANTEERLASIYGEDYTFAVKQNEPQGAVVEIRIPFKDVRTELEDQSSPTDNAT